MEEKNKKFKSGFVSIVGKPNVGKSTLLNRLMGQPIVGVSAKPQTTRKRQLGILTNETAQIIFVDSPGLHEPKDRLSQFINTEAEFALKDADIILFLADGATPPDTQDQLLAEKILELAAGTPTLMALNKSDAVSGRVFADNRKLFEKLIPEARQLPISAQTGEGVAQLLSLIGELLPEGPEYYPQDQITDEFERHIAAEMIRAAAMSNLEDELPYAIAVRTDEYSERENGTIYIKATIFVERDGQKAIVVGKGGERIKKIGSKARVDIEAMSGEKVYLDLTVKVKNDWKNDTRFLRALGLGTDRS
ncbi:MAG: GTPase Era [Anaerolineaceae bacterium]|jgi:GTP-binding protein Era